MIDGVDPSTSDGRKKILDELELENKLKIIFKI